eukprot:2522395-Rhodomonas_salina.2
MVLAAYALSGTGIAYGAICLRIVRQPHSGWPTRYYGMSGTHTAYGTGFLCDATRCPVQIAAVSPYARATRCPGIRQYMNLAHKNLIIAASGRRFQVKSASCLRACYAVSGLGIACGAIRLRAVRCLRVCYEESGTEAGVVRYQEFEFSYSNTPELTDDQEVVAALYNETIDSFITAAGISYPYAPALLRDVRY